MANIKALDVKGQNVIVRVDFNVPLDKEFKITDDTRLRGALRTIQYLTGKGARVILLSHFDRPLKKLTPEGQIDRKKFTLHHIVNRLSELLNQEVGFSEESTGETVMNKVASL